VALARTLLCGALIALVSCNRTDSREAGSVPLSGSAGEAVLVPTLRVRVSGDTVALALTVANAGREGVRLSFGTAQRYDFAVRNEAGVEVWRWSAERMFGQVAGEEEVPSGGVLEYHEAWVARAAGRYRVVARLESSDHPLELESEFEVPAR